MFKQICGDFANKCFIISRRLEPMINFVVGLEWLDDTLQPIHEKRGLKKASLKD